MYLMILFENEIDKSLTIKELTSFSEVKTHADSSASWYSISQLGRASLKYSKTSFGFFMFFNFSSLRYFKFFRRASFLAP